MGTRAIAGLCLPSLLAQAPKTWSQVCTDSVANQLYAVTAWLYDPQSVQLANKHLLLQKESCG